MSIKEVKSRARNTLKHHYFLLVFICLICSIIGAEFITSLPDNSTKKITNNISEYIQDIDQYGIEGAQEKVNKRIEESKKNETEVFGRSRGVFSEIVNAFDSGSIIINIYSTIDSVSKSKTWSMAILILGCLLLYFIIWTYLINTFKIIIRRMSLEMRIYEKIPSNRFMFLFYTKTVINTGLAYLKATIYQILWSLTIVGGFVKHYSYLMVPYILAENPKIKGKDAIKMSREMMNGYKLEAFKLDLSFIGWLLLSGITFGISAILYSNPYRLQCFSEFYSCLRNKYIKNKNYKYFLLNDKYLYKKANGFAILRKYGKEMLYINKPIKVIEYRNPIKRFLYDNFGIYFSQDMEDSHEKYLTQQYKSKKYKNIIDRKMYPMRLFSIPMEERSNIGSMNYMRHYRITHLIMMFFIFSIGGWIWEVMLHLINTGIFVNRGTMFGPWLPIYGWGSVFVLVLLYRYRNNPIKEFAAIVILCGSLEYLTSVYLEYRFGLSWWNYKGYFLNIDGRICAEGLLVFGLGGMAAVYVVAPLIDNLLNRINSRVLVAICIVLLCCFNYDLAYTHMHPNTGTGISKNVIK